MAGFPRSDHICKHIHAVCRLNVYSNTDLAFNEESIECILKAVGYTKRTTYNNLEHTREDAMSKLMLTSQIEQCNNTEACMLKNTHLALQTTSYIWCAMKLRVLRHLIQSNQFTQKFFYKGIFFYYKKTQTCNCAPGKTNRRKKKTY